MCRPVLLHTWCPSKFLLIDCLQSLCACCSQPILPVAVFLPRPFVIRKIFTAAVFCVPSVQIVQYFLPLCPFLRVRPEMLPPVFGRRSAYPPAVCCKQEPFNFRYHSSVPEIKCSIDAIPTEPLIHDIVHALLPHTQKPGAKPKEARAVRSSTVPLVFTFSKPSELLASGERSHQRAAALVPLCLYFTLLFPAE